MGNKVKAFHDIETGETITTEQLYSEWQEIAERGETCETFGEYVWNCQTFNGGTLEEVNGLSPFC